MNSVELHERAAREFGSRVVAVAEDQWHLPTPCTEWDVRALVHHVVTRNLMVPSLLQGLPVLPPPGDPLGADPAAAWERSVHQANSAFAAPGALDVLVPHPMAGEVRGEMLALFRWSDMLVHSWDLARAIGTDERLDPGLVGVCLERTRPRVPFMRATGMFGSPVEVPEGADEQTELLALFGRSAWSPSRDPA